MRAFPTAAFAEKLLEKRSAASPAKHHVSRGLAQLHFSGRALRHVPSAPGCGACASLPGSASGVTSAAPSSFHGQDFIERVEVQAKTNPRFAWMLGGVWQFQMS